LTLEEYRLLGLDINSKGTQDKIVGSITLGDGNAIGLSQIFKDGGDLQQFQQVKVPKGIAGESNQAIIKRRKKEEEILVFDPKKDVSMENLFKQKNKRSTSTRKYPQGISIEEFDELILEKNYNFPLNRLTKLALRPMLLKLKLDTKQMNLKERAMDQSEGIVVDTQIGDENNFVAEGAEAIEEELNAYRELEQRKDELEINFDNFSKIVNARVLKAKLWSHIEKNKVDEDERDAGLLYRTDFSSLFSYIKSTQECSPQACFVCLLHLANEKGNFYSLIGRVDDSTVSG
jgi:hypothetical protein